MCKQQFVVDPCTEAHSMSNFLEMRYNFRLTRFDCPSKDIHIRRKDFALGRDIQSTNMSYFHYHLVNIGTEARSRDLRQIRTKVWFGRNISCPIGWHLLIAMVQLFFCRNIREQYRIR